MSKPSQLKVARSTSAVQAGHAIDQETGAVVPPVYLSSTYARDENYDTRQEYYYSRDGSKNVDIAENVIQTLEGGQRSLLFNSGLSAVATFLECLPAGAHVVAPDVMYHGCINWLHRLQDQKRLTFTQFSQADPSSLEQAIRPNETTLVWIETPANPNWDVVDIAWAADLAHQAGALLFCDATGAPPCTCRPLELGADYSFHSATKYLNGHSDITAGVITTAKADAFWNDLALARKLMGTAPQAFESWLLTRGMRTLFVRYRQASENAMAVAEYLSAHPTIEQVLYPGLPSHPGHEIAKRQMTDGFGGMLSVLVKGDHSLARDVARFCQVWMPATSLGGVESLIEHRKVVEGPNSIVPDTLLRLSTGIEDKADLIADLEQALDRASQN